MGSSGKHRLQAFTLVELIVVIAIIGIMAALIVAVVANATKDTRLVIARQQQAVLQEALNAWVAGFTLQNSVASARTTYSNAATAGAKFALISNYLDAKTVYSFTNPVGSYTYSSSSTSLMTDAMAANGVSVTFSTWTTSSYPTVLMQ